ncbi:hypothetical protein O0L34_g3127 [Tuta absoluta]|nr:hypothetical protein O0L34_g3127 [Tuta absoluta]
MKMSSPLYLAVLVLMVAYCKSDTIAPKDAEPRSCHQCSGASCEAPPATITCPPERPLCATAAAAPNYTSSLTCATGGDTPCSLTYSPNLTMTCVCAGNLCNKPFSKELQQELITFSLLDIPKNRTDFTDIFWKHSRLINDNEINVYSKITITSLQTTETPNNIVSEISTASTSEPASVSAEAYSPEQNAGQYGQQYTGFGEEPRAEMLRLETTMPSDDDEDESEGSGSDDDTLGLRRTSPSAADDDAASPASPSTYSPTEDSDATRPFLALIATIPAFYYMLV